MKNVRQLIPGLSFLEITGFKVEGDRHGRHINITELVLPETANDPVHESAIVYLSCQVFKGGDKLCRPSDKGSTPVKC